MKRKKDWFERLVAFLAKHQNTSFEWGAFDCCLFVADAIVEMTDIDIATPFRGKYKTEKGAIRALMKYGDGDVKSTFTQLLGPFKPRLNAGRGDVALVSTSTGNAVGIVFNNVVWVASPDGLITIPLRAALGCWSVPCHQ